MNNWIARTAKNVVRFAEAKKGPGAQIVCASGITPSGSVHLGNLREIMTVHLVHEELLRQGYDSVHLHFWDDFDRLRKIPSNVSKDFDKHLGKPLSAIPNPYGGEGSWADHFVKEFEECMERIGVKPRYIRQSEIYATNTYAPLVVKSLENRDLIFEILLKHQSEAKQQESLKKRDKYYPFAVYSAETGTDNTEILNFTAETQILTYLCKDSGKEFTLDLNKELSGKLVWKVDWPMRWTHYQVDFEPGGVDHSTPGSSYTVGKEMAKRVFGWHAPSYAAYAFVSISGQGAKISSSSGTIATPSNALSVLEPAMLRWLYVRTDVKKGFKVSFDDQIMRLYDEWDRFAAKNRAGNAKELEAFIFAHATQSSQGKVPFSEEPIPFRILTSAYEMTKGSPQGFKRVVDEYAEQANLEASQRVQLARNWVDDFMPEEDKVSIRETINQEVFNSLKPEFQQALGLFAESLSEAFNVSTIQQNLYGVPKKILGLPLDAKPTPELKAFQKEFYQSLYQLFIDKEKGPRLPTLVMAVGQDKARELLQPS